MALTLVVILDNTGLTDIFDLQGIEYGAVPDKGFIVMADDAHPDLGTKLWAPTDGIIQIEDLEAVLAVTAITPQPPTGLADPTSSAVTATGFKVNWTAPTGGDAVTGYAVTVTKAGSDITGSPFSMAGSTLVKTVSGLTADTDYKVKVEAVNAAGNISSSEITITTGA